METKTFLFTTSFYPPYHIGGDAMHVAYLAEELVGRGHEVHVLHSIDAYNLKRKATVESQDSNGVETHPCRSPFGVLSPISAYAIGKSPHVSRRFSAVVKDVSPDIVHHHNVSLLGINIMRRRGKYLNLHTAHDHWLICPRNDMLYKGNSICIDKACLGCVLASRRVVQPWRNGIRSVLKDLDRIIAPSNNLKSMLLEEFGNGISQIYNFVPEPPEHIVDLGINDYFLFVGALEEHKGIRILIDAYESSGIDSRLVIVGDGKLRSYVEKRVKNSSLKDRMAILGQVERSRLYGLYKWAKVLVLPSICYENCPLVLLEALSVGTPVLGSDIGGIQEVIRLSESGTVFQCDSSKLRDSLVDVDQDVESQRRYRRNAEESYSRWFSPNAFMTAYEREIEMRCQL